MKSAEAVDSLVSGLDTLADVNLDALPDAALDELLTQLQRVEHRLGAQLCRVADRWSQRGVWSSDGSKSAAARLGRDGHRSWRSAHTILSRGRHLAAAPHVTAACCAGDLSADQADLLASAAAGRQAMFARDEELLVTQAQSLRFVQLCKAVDYWRHRVDAELGCDDGTEPSAEPSLSLTPVGDLVAIDGQLDPVGGGVVGKAIEAIASELAADDQTCGRPMRARPVLRAAALVEIARRAMAMPAGAQRAKILLQIVCGHDAFAELCELSNGTVVRPGQIVPYLDALDIRSIVFDSATHAIATSSQRTFIGALRGVIQVRDRHCQHPSGCDEPIDRCDVDHIIPWSQTGDTSQDNGRLLCTFHNRIQPPHTRPPATCDNSGKLDHLDVLGEAVESPSPTGQCHIYHITYAELLQRGP